MEPVFIHDCTDCEFFGTTKGMDMYICQRFDTKIVRYGDDGPDYVSSSNHTFSELIAMA